MFFRDKDHPSIYYLLKFFLFVYEVDGLNKSIDRFSLYGLFSHFRPRDATRGDSPFKCRLMRKHLMSLLKKHVISIINKSDLADQGNFSGALGIAYYSLGKFQKTIEYHEKELKVAIEIGDRARKGGAYGNLGNTYFSLGDFQKAIEYHEKHFKISIEIGNRARE